MATRAEVPTLDADALRLLYERETPDIAAYYTRLHVRCRRLLRDHGDYLNAGGIALMKRAAYAAYLAKRATERDL